jgi:hypothetical protein
VDESRRGLRVPVRRRRRRPCCCLPTFSGSDLFVYSSFFLKDLTCFFRGVKDKKIRLVLGVGVGRTVLIVLLLTALLRGLCFLCFFSEWVLSEFLFLLLL